MCEIPNNVMCVDEFCRLFDGISIGANDLTQLTLDVDRDSEFVAFGFDERNRSVLRMLRLDDPEVAEFLVRLGIDALSLNPDTVVATRVRVAAVERKLEKENNA